jgi:hypothetical protein
MKYKLNNNCSCKKTKEPFQNVLSENTIESENIVIPHNTPFLEKIDMDMDEIIGDTKIVIGESIFLIKDYKYWIIIFLIILIFLIVRSTT